MKKQKYLSAQLQKTKNQRTALSNARVELHSNSIAATREHAAAMASDDTGRNLMDALKSLSLTAKVQASAQAGATQIDPKLVRSLKDLAAAWSQVHAEVRTSLQALTDDDFRNLLMSQHSSERPLLTPHAQGNDEQVEIEQPSPNFPLPEVHDASHLDDPINGPISTPAMSLIDFDDE